MTTYKDAFINEIISKSISNIWNESVKEWDITEWEEDIEMDSSCICGKENIKYLFTIENKFNNETLFPIGSKCIRKFERKDLNELISEKEALFKLFEKVKNNEFLTLKESGFTKKLLKYFLKQNIFLPTQYNDYDGENDYDFLVDMFNKRTDPTNGQQKKIRGLIAYTIKPYLIKELAKRTSNYKENE